MARSPFPGPADEAVMAFSAHLSYRSSNSEHRAEQKGLRLREWRSSESNFSG